MSTPRRSSPVGDDAYIYHKWSYAGPLGYGCPRCNSAPGEGCKSPWYSDKKWRGVRFHRERLTLWEFEYPKPFPFCKK